MVPGIDADADFLQGIKSVSVVCFDIWNMAHLKPFLADMDEDDAASFFTAELPPQFPPPPPPRPNYSHLKLPIFWADAPVA